MANSCFKRCHHMQDHLGIDLMTDELKRILRSEIEGSTGPVVNGDHHVNTMLIVQSFFDVVTEASALVVLEILFHDSLSTNDMDENYIGSLSESFAIPLSCHLLNLILNAAFQSHQAAPKVEISQLGDGWVQTMLRFSEAKNNMFVDYGFFFTLVSKNTENTSAASLLRGYAKIEPLPMADLNEFIITTIPKGLNASSRLFSMFLEMSPGTSLKRWKVSPTSLKCPSMAPSESGSMFCAWFARQTPSRIWAAAEMSASEPTMSAAAPSLKSAYHTKGPRKVTAVISEKTKRHVRHGCSQRGPWRDGGQCHRRSNLAGTS
ncbi:hypothetical protein HID58_022325 [Brassica napus]|uniref:Uncharacterized protein n=1 Tax=Brassica napus TaxID=3708 RepID=A0ABQ8CYX3_BRANA|nr:hypothetical protein HID58_022325 [Brassica napus]